MTDSNKNHTPPGLPVKPWDEEKAQMLEVIKKYSNLYQNHIKVIKSQRDVIKDLKNRVEKYENDQNIAFQDDISLDVPEVHFSDVGGLDSVLETIREFEYSITMNDVYIALGETPPKSLLLHGPPGCGKTLIAKAMANELDCFFVDLPLTKIISKWVGEAEKTLDAVLSRAVSIYEQHQKKVLIFVDEAEQMFIKRGSNIGHNVNDRIVNVWLRYLDGMKSSEGLIVVAATNKVELMDEAVIRDKRFDYIIEIPKPNRKGVYEILEKLVAYRERNAGRRIYENLDYEKLAGLIYDRGMSMFPPGATGAMIDNILSLTNRRLIKEYAQQNAIVNGIDDTQELPPMVIDQDTIETTIRLYNRSQKEKPPIGFGNQKILVGG